MPGKPKALILSGYGLNCDYETHYCLLEVGAESERVHINDLIPVPGNRAFKNLDDYHILVFDGGFSWGDEHGAGVILASRIKIHLGESLNRFIEDGKLVIGVCNGFQALVNLGLLPGFKGNYTKREVALITNDCGNFRDDWVGLIVNRNSPCVFTRGMDFIELPIRHGEGKFYTTQDTMERLVSGDQVVFQYCGPDRKIAGGLFPFNPNGSLKDIAGICDPTGRVLGLMPHPEAYNHLTNHPDWPRREHAMKDSGMVAPTREGEGMIIYRNAVSYVRETLLR